MIHRPNNQAVSDYFAATNIPSQSRLKLLLKGVDAYNNVQGDTEAEVLFYEEKQHFILGQAAELKVQQGSAEFDKLYYMSDKEKPSDTLMSIYQQLFDMQLRVHDEFTTIPNIVTPEGILNPFTKEDLLTCINSHNYYPKWGEEARLKSVLKGYEYYEELQNSFGKQTLSLDEATITNAVSHTWLHNSRTKRYFQDLPGIDFFYQLPIYCTIMGVEVKCLIDILEVNHNEKYIQVNDLKTLSGFTIEFPNSLRKLRYDFQGCFYTLCVLEWMKGYEPFKDYKIKLPNFIVETTKLGKQGNPLIYTMTEDLMENAYYGRAIETTSVYWDNRNMENRSKIIANKFGGVIQALNIYKWHLQFGFQYDKVVGENKGHLLLTWEGIQS